MVNRLRAFLGANVRTAAAFLFLCALAAPARAQISGGTVDQGAGSNLSPWYVQFLASQHIICDSGCGSPPAVPDDDPFTFGTTSVSIIAAVVDDTSTNTVAENSYGAPRMDTNRILYTKFVAAQHIICDTGCGSGPVSIDTIETTDTTGTITGSGNVTLDTTGRSMVRVQFLVGSCTDGALAFKASPDAGSNYHTVTGVDNQTGVPAASWSCNQGSETFDVNVAGFDRFRIVDSSPTDATVDIRIVAMAANSSGVTITNSTIAVTQYPGTFLDARLRDETGVGVINTVSSPPGGGETGLVTYNIPSGTQDVNVTNASVPIEGNVIAVGFITHDNPIGVTNKPLLTGGFASAAAPTDVSADGDAVASWYLRNGSQVTNLATAGTLYDARQTRSLLFATDKIDVSGSSVTTVSSGFPAKTGWGPGGLRVQLSTDSKVGLVGPFRAAAASDSDEGIVTRPATSARTSPTGQLTVVCADAAIDTCGAGSFVEIVPSGYGSVTVLLTNTDTAGTIKMDYMPSNSSVWFSSILYILNTRGTATVPTAGKDLQVVIAAGTTHVLLQAIQTGAINKIRVRLAARTAGSTVSATLTANTLTDPFGLALSAQSPGQATNVAIPSAIGLSDGTTTCTLGGAAIFPCIGYAQGRTADPATADSGLVTRSPHKRTYGAALNVKTATAAGTAAFATICGSATTTVRVLRARADYTIATAGVHADVRLAKYSSAPTGGTATTLTQTPFDSTFAAGTATNVSYYTVLPTGGLALVGAIDNQMRWGQITATVTAGSQPTSTYEYRTNDAMEGIVLRGTAQCVGMNFGTTTTNAPTMTVSWLWTEE